jgi:hypothetical protein
VDAYPLLKRYIYDFEDVIQALTKWFVGRDAVFQELGQFEKNPRSAMRFWKMPLL